MRFRPVTIVPGEAVTSTWCANCQLPTRLRIPLHDRTVAGPLLAVLEVCPGCGANHATPAITVTRIQHRPLRHPVAAAANAVNNRKCEKAGLPAVLCACGDCQMPGRWDCTWELRADEGVTRYLFCKPAHRTEWLELNGLAVTHDGG